jgi:hypothetical protein
VGNSLAKRDQPAEVNEWRWPVAIGRHDPKTAHDADVRQAIAVGLNEALTALEESFYDLRDEQLHSFPVPGRNNIMRTIYHTMTHVRQIWRLRGSWAGQMSRADPDSIGRRAGRCPADPPHPQQNT